MSILKTGSKMLAAPALVLTMLFANVSNDGVSLSPTKAFADCVCFNQKGKRPKITKDSVIMTTHNNTTSMSKAKSWCKEDITELPKSSQKAIDYCVVQPQGGNSNEPLLFRLDKD